MPRFKILANIVQECINRKVKPKRANVLFQKLKVTAGDVEMIMPKTEKIFVPEKKPLIS